MASFDNVFASPLSEQQHPKVPAWSASLPLCVSASVSLVFDVLVQGAAAPQVKHSEMSKLLETTAEKISGLVRNKRR